MGKYWFLKLFLIGLITIVLIIAMSQITRLVSERETRQHEAAARIQGAWSGPQQVAGPILVVPIRDERVPSPSHPSLPAMLYLLPESLSIETQVTPHLRHRGLFETVVYTADLTLRGHFEIPERGLMGHTATSFDWPKATINFGLSELRGLQGSPRLNFGEKDVELNPHTGQHTLFAQTIAGTDLDTRSMATSGTADFELTLSVNGSGSLEVLPLGRETRMTQASEWPNPSFQGAFLPTSHDVGTGGFTAEWAIPRFANSHPHAWIIRGPLADDQRRTLTASTIGTEFLPPVDFYQQVSRCTKYAILFVTLTFAIFFLFELLTGLRIHPMQYLMVGFAICLFYLLLLAVAEHIGFGAAYLAAATATIVLISGYSAAVLRTVRRAAILASILATLYGILYVLVQMQTFTLLVGSIGLFLALAMVMYLTRNIDWYALSGGPLKLRPEATADELSIQAS